MAPRITRDLVGQMLSRAGEPVNDDVLDTHWYFQIEIEALKDVLEVERRQIAHLQEELTGLVKASYLEARRAPGHRRVAATAPEPLTATQRQLARDEALAAVASAADEAREELEFHRAEEDAARVNSVRACIEVVDGFVGDGEAVRGHAVGVAADELGGFHSSGHYVGYWIQRRVVDEGGRKACGKVIGQLRAHESGHFDDDGKPAALYRVKYERGEIDSESDYEDLDLWELQDSHPTSVNPREPCEYENLRKQRIARNMENLGMIGITPLSTPETKVSQRQATKNVSQQKSSERPSRSKGLSRADVFPGMLVWRRDDPTNAVWEVRRVAQDGMAEAWVARLGGGAAELVGLRKLDAVREAADVGAGPRPKDTNFEYSTPSPGESRKSGSGQGKVKTNGLGYFTTAEEAAREYDVVARYLGRPVNFPEEGEQQAKKGVRRDTGTTASKAVTEYLCPAYVGVTAGIGPNSPYKAQIKAPEEAVRAALREHGTPRVDFLLEHHDEDNVAAVAHAPRVDSVGERRERSGMSSPRPDVEQARGDAVNLPRQSSPMLTDSFMSIDKGMSIEEGMDIDHDVVRAAFQHEIDGLMFNCCYELTDGSQRFAHLLRHGDVIKKRLDRGKEYHAENFPLLFNYEIEHLRKMFLEQCKILVRRSTRSSATKVKNRLELDHGDRIAT